MIVIVTDSTACLNRQEAQRLGVTHVRRRDIINRLYY